MLGNEDKSGFSDSYFGMFKYDEDFEYFENCGPNGQYSLCLAIPCREFLEKLLRLAGPKSQRIEEAKIFACDKLLGLANDWAQQAAERAKDAGDEANSVPVVIDRKTFADAMIIIRINISEADEFEFWFECQNGMFTDHGILVSGDIKNGFIDAAIV